MSGMSRDTASVRLAHFSDIHVTTATLAWRFSDWFSKRTTGWVNHHWLARGREFRRADEVVRALAAEISERRPERAVFSGDASVLGFEAEYARATELLGVGAPDGVPGLAVPGNHDYYTKAAAASGLFERYFAPWQAGERVDGATYPFAQQVGSLWLIAVNSCTGNVWPWDASGAVDEAQLERLGRLLGRLGRGPRILVTHYPVCLAGGEAERRHHGLCNVGHVVRVAREGGICLWLHGHRHGAYHLVESCAAPFPVVCVGSATEHGHWSYGEYTITGQDFRARQRVYRAERHAFVDGPAFELRLAC
jgi:3',5'-cyclic AMP phosphodiesterase CpdA